MEIRLLIADYKMPHIVYTNCRPSRNFTRKFSAKVRVRFYNEVQLHVAEKTIHVHGCVPV
jgi:hypothetical protein